MHTPRELAASTIHGLARQLIHHQFSLRLRADDLAALDHERRALVQDMGRIRHLISGVQNKVNWELSHNGALLDGHPATRDDDDDYDEDDEP